LKKGISKLFNTIGHRHVLLIVDDIKHQSHALWLHQGAKSCRHCKILFTTRLKRLANENRVVIAQMSETEALELIFDMQSYADIDLTVIEQLIGYSGCWLQLISLMKSLLKMEVERCINMAIAVERMVAQFERAGMIRLTDVGLQDYVRQHNLTVAMQLNLRHLATERQS